ncbi:hypothetical protein P22_3698 [Propionispora sp. 2/2-37]|uniref:DegV family protein n=1 Tax=Propionispora sp. 2/2-37 TaxID=1677858 RepID=UPI0006BB8ED5|nr:DegV family protein [Propionispora sp. 2/2-37]CUH97567.1 hypothetical protein P22_3698 [Propionispora sp. 2/2-37]
MSDIHFVVDSTCNVLPEFLAAHPNIHVVPLKVLFGEQEYREDCLMAADVFQLAAKLQKHPMTSQPSHGDFIKVLEPLAREGKPVVVITLAAGLSGTWQGASAVVREQGWENIYVVNSCSVGSGILSMLHKALEMSHDGAEAVAIAGELNRMARKNRVVFMVDSLGFLHKGGRIGGAAALFGSILQIKPLLYLGADSQVGVLDKVRTQSKAIARMMEEIEQPPAYISVANIGMEEAAEEVRLALARRFPDVPVLAEQLGAVLAVHVGPGVLGIIYREK